MDTAGGHSAVYGGAFNPLKLCDGQVKGTVHADEWRLVY